MCWCESKVYYPILPILLPLDGLVHPVDHALFLPGLDQIAETVGGSGEVPVEVKKLYFIKTNYIICKLKQ